MDISCPEMLFVYKVLFQPSVHTGDVPQVQPLPKATPETAARKGEKNQGSIPEFQPSQHNFASPVFGFYFYPEVWGAFHLFIYLFTVFPEN